MDRPLAKHATTPTTSNNAQWRDRTGAERCLCYDDDKETEPLLWVPYLHFGGVMFPFIVILPKPLSLTLLQSYRGLGQIHFGQGKELRLAWGELAHRPDKTIQ